MNSNNLVIKKVYWFLKPHTCTHACARARTHLSCLFGRRSILVQQSEKDRRFGTLCACHISRAQAQHRPLSQVGSRRKRCPGQFGQDGMGSIPATPPSSMPASIEISIKANCLHKHKRQFTHTGPSSPGQLCYTNTAGQHESAVVVDCSDYQQLGMRVENPDLLRSKIPLHPRMAISMYHIQEAPRSGHHIHSSNPSSKCITAAKPSD
jgi:hypothetical protein